MKSRKQTIGLAYAATGGAKIFGALVQLAVLPIAANALGIEAFGLLFAVAALASFPLIAMAGFSPAASAFIAKAKASSEDDRVGGYFWSLWFWSVISGAALSGLTYFALMILNLPGASDSDLVVVFILFVFANFVAAPIDGTRAAFSESHYTSGFAIVGSAFTLLMVLFASDRAGVSYYFAAIYLVPATTQIVNLGLFIAQHRRQVGMMRLDGDVRGEFLNLLTTSILAQSGIVIYLHGGVLILANLFGTASVAVIGAFIRVALLVHSMLLALFMPVFPTITTAVTRGDKPWIRRAIFSLGFIASGVLLAQVTTTIVFGNWIVEALLGAQPSQKGYFPYIATAGFVFFYSITHLLFLIRVSTVTANAKGAKILGGAVIGLLTGCILAPNDIAMFTALQTISLALIATISYGLSTAKYVFGE